MYLTPQLRQLMKLCVYLSKDLCSAYKEYIFDIIDISDTFQEAILRIITWSH